MMSFLSAIVISRVRSTAFVTIPVTFICSVLA